MSNISELKFDDKNFNKHTEYGMSLLEKSLRENGAGRSILLDKDNNIIAGNGIIEAAGSVGLENVKIVETTGDEIVAVKRTDISLNSKKGREMALADNATVAVDLDWDEENLKSEFDEGELKDWGVDLGWQEETEVDEDEAPEVNESEPADSVLGMVYQLGDHRLMCGDSTDAGSVAILMDGQKADMVFTDPPYGMKKENQGVLNDNLNYDKLLEFNKIWIPLTFDNLKENGSWYCWGIDEPLMDIYSNILKPMIKENKITFRNLLTWDKGNGQGQNAEEFRSYPIADEKCLFIMSGTQNADGILDASETLGVYLEYMTKELAKSGLTEKELNEICDYKSIANHWTFNKDGSQKQPRLIQKEDYLKIQKYCQENNIDAFKKEYDEIKQDWYETRAYFNNTHDNMNNVWHFDRTSSKERKLTGGHATPKPIALCARAIKSSSRKEEVVLDVFGGSGTTLIACEQLGRKCYMMELDPHYCDVIRKRYWKFTHEGNEEGWQDGTRAV